MVNQTSEANLSPVKTGKQPSHFFVSLIWGVLLFILLCIGLEAAFRVPAINRHFPLRSVGSYHAQFEIKWFKLQEYVHQNGGVDVILLGNSMVNTGIDPAVMAARYKELTGADLRIFNFGVEGMTVAPLSTLAKMITERYHPGTVLLYTEMRDYVGANGVSVETQFLSNDWIKNQLGSQTPKGGLIESSAALKFILPFRDWSRSDFLDSFFMDLRRVKETSTQGYEADQNIGTGIDIAPDPNDPKEQKSFELFSNFIIDSSRANDLRRIINLQSSGTKVLVTEMSVYPTYYIYFGDESVHQKYLTDIDKIVKDSGSHFIPALPYDLIPLDGRSDNHHLNFQGAPLYSNLLAEKLASLCLEQQICLTAAAGAGNQP